MQYMVKRAVDIAGLEDHLNFWAAKGWRVVSLQPMMGYMYVVVFERSLPDD